MLFFRGRHIAGVLYLHPITQPCASVVKHVPLSPSDAIMSDGRVKSMEGEEFHIKLIDDAQPFCVHMHICHTPFAYREKLQDELALVQTQGIIAPVTTTTPAEWCAPIVIDYGHDRHTTYYIVSFHLT